MIFTQLYKKIRKKLPASLAGALTKLARIIKGKPIVMPQELLVYKGFPNHQKGGMILSADFELAWAPRFTKRHPNPLEHAIKLAKQERKNVPQLLSLFEKHHIPVTWATVGHLFLSSYDEFDHNAMKRIPHFETEWIRFTEGDWFDNVPKTSWQEAPEWYCPDLIKMIISSKVNHEIATHTFSHVNFSDKYCPPEVADDEINASMNVMKPYGITPVSICFPFGTWGNVPVLKKHGIKIYRRKLLAYQMAYPYKDEHGLLVTLSTDAFDRSNPAYSAKSYKARFIKAINKAIKTGTVANFVFHPSMDPWMISEVMDEVLGYAAKKRDEGALWIGTMKEIAEHINSR
jgi:peptidoglycan/xylan/chitin deacetylase (PgdA/CDA1 family)